MRTTVSISMKWRRRWVRMFRYLRGRRRRHLALRRATFGRRRAWIIGARRDPAATRRIGYITHFRRPSLYFRCTAVSLEGRIPRASLQVLWCTHPPPLRAPRPCLRRAPRTRPPQPLCTTYRRPRAADAPVEPLGDAFKHVHERRRARAPKEGQRGLRSSRGPRARERWPQRLR